MSEATARLPWRISEKKIGKTVYRQEIIDADGKRVLDVFEVESNRRDAHPLALIVKAVNGHALLVEALEKARRDLRDYGAAPIQQVCEDLKQALEEAKP